MTLRSCRLLLLGGLAFVLASSLFPHAKADPHLVFTCEFGLYAENTVFLELQGDGSGTARIEGIDHSDEAEIHWASTEESTTVFVTGENARWLGTFEHQASSAVFNGNEVGTPGGLPLEGNCGPGRPPWTASPFRGFSPLQALLNGGVCGQFESTDGQTIKFDDGDGLSTNSPHFWLTDQREIYACALYLQPRLGESARSQCVLNETDHVFDDVLSAEVVDDEISRLEFRSTAFLPSCPR